MSGYAFLDDEPPEKPINYVPEPNRFESKTLNSIVHQESECAVILFMFIGGLILLNLMESRK